MKFLWFSSKNYSQGGKFYFLDIVSYPRDDKFRNFWQHMFQPIWYFSTMGCKAGGIDCLKTLSDAGFDVSRMKTTNQPSWQWSFSHYLYGTAVKPKQSRL